MPLLQYEMLELSYTFSAATFLSCTLQFLFCVGCASDKSLGLPQWPLSVRWIFMLPEAFLSIIVLYCLNKRESIRRDKAGAEVTSSCVHSGHVPFQGQDRLLLFFCCFVKAAVTQVNVFKCQEMICISGYDPKKIRHATLVSGQKNG